MNAFFRPEPTEDAVTKAETAALRVRSYLELQLAQAKDNAPHSFLAQYTSMAEGELDQSRIARPDHSDDHWRHGISPHCTNSADGATAVPSRAVAFSLRRSVSHRSVVFRRLTLRAGIAGVVRVSVQDIEIGDWILPAGQLVLLYGGFGPSRRKRLLSGRMCSTSPDLTWSWRGWLSAVALTDALPTPWQSELEIGLAVLVERLRGFVSKTCLRFRAHVRAQHGGVLGDLGQMI